MPAKSNNNANTDIVVDSENQDRAGFFEALSNSSLQRFVSATLLWGTGHQLITLSQGYLLFEMTASTLWLAALGAAVAIPNVIVGVIGGVLADRVPQTRLLKFGAVVAGIPMLMIAILYVSGTLAAWHIVLAGMFQGAGLAVDWISRLSLLPDVVPRNILIRSISLDQSVFNGARVLGPVVGGLLLGVTGPGPTYAVIAGLFGLTYLVYTTFNPTKQTLIARSVGVLSDLKEVIQVIRERPILRVNLMFTWVNAMVLGGLVFMLPAFAKQVFLTDESGLGFLFASVGTGAVLGAITVSWTGGIQRAGLALLLTDLMFGGLIVIWAHSNGMPIALSLAFLIGYFNSVHVAFGIAVIQFNVPAEVRGRVIGAYEIAWSGFPMGGLASGSLAAFFGLSNALIVLAGSLIVFTIFIALVSDKFRQSKIE